jgi:hypothetical protein
MIIGSAPEVFSLGELAFYNVYRSKERFDVPQKHLCTCGEEFDNCFFWEKIDKSGQYKIKKKYSFVENIVLFLKILFNTKCHKSDDTHKIGSEILNEARNENEKVKYLLDSSKDPRRLYSLLNDDRIEVFPILLTRDCIKVAKSYSQKDRPFKCGLKPKNYIMSLLFRCYLVNFLAKRLVGNKNRGLVLSYERFCDNPKAHIRLLNGELGIHIDEENYLDNVNSNIYHNIDGNRLRFDKIEKIEKR